MAHKMKLTKGEKKDFISGYNNGYKMSITGIISSVVRSDDWIEGFRSGVGARRKEDKLVKENKLKAFKKLV